MAMRLGCTGCLAVVLVIGLMLTGMGAVLVGAVRAFQEPRVAPPATTAADGARAQRKLLDVVRGGGRAGEGKEVVLTETELNAFLSRHLAEAAELPLREAGVKLRGNDVVEFVGRVPARYLMAEPPLASLQNVLPEWALESRAWLALRGRIRLEPGTTREERRYLRLDVERFAVGRQRLPALFLRLALSPVALRLLRWQMPATVESVSIEPGRVLIRTASSR